METPSVGDTLPLVTTPVGAGRGGGREERVAVAGDAALAQHEAHERPRERPRQGRLQGRPADEVARLVQPDDPAQARFERVHGPVELVAVEGHAGLQAQRVAGTQPDRHEPDAPARLHQRVPQGRGGVPRHEQLEAVLAGVAGPGEQGIRAGHPGLGDAVVAQGAQVGVDQRRDDALGARALDGEQGGPQRGVIQAGVEAGQALAHGRRSRPPGCPRWAPRRSAPRRGGRR